MAAVHNETTVVTTRSMISRILLFITVLTGLCTPTALSAEPVKLGSIITLTGDMAAWGERCQRAYTLALEDVRGQPPEITLIIEDSPQSLPKHTVSAFRKLDSIDRVAAILGVFSVEEVDAIVPLLKRANLGLLSFVPGKTHLRSGLFLWPHPEYEARYAARSLRERYSKVAVLADGSAWTEQVSLAFKAEFERLGGVITSLQIPPIDTKQVGTEVLRVKKSGAEAVFIPSYYLFLQYVKELSALKLTLPRYGVELDESMRVLAASFGEGVRFIRPAASQELDRRFKQRFGTLADLPASYCYDQVMLVHRVLKSLPEAQRSSRQEIQKALQNVTEHQGVSGLLHFTAEGTQSPLAWFQFTANGIVEVGAP